MKSLLNLIENKPTKFYNHHVRIYACLNIYICKCSIYTLGDDLGMPKLYFFIIQLIKNLKNEDIKV